MDNPKLYLDLSREDNNLHIERGNLNDVVYKASGFLSEDGDIVSFNDDTSLIKNDGNKKLILDNITKIDIDYMLEFTVITFSRKSINAYKYTSDKIRNLISIGKEMYEVPLIEHSAIENYEAAKILLNECYAFSFENEPYSFKATLQAAFHFLFKEKIEVFYSSILDDESFISDVGEFAEDYGVEFEQSEGTELLLAAIFISRRRLHTSWIEVYKILKEQAG